ncbi:hypothetical protein EJC49_11185 [Aquibium carbonis]|uniref:Uncharacterized protein n=1 Tax=Aquibium carbonis TaxID=2495581 RepID=A0A3R9ZS02_9HYPH|nr:hypothetical protein [Aquibium carbonis]RST86328.1 hypothetical protein EJC49_11185 [Aquibium carbonis]
MTGRPDRNRLKAALWLLAGSLAWALAIGASAALSLLWREWQNRDAQAFVVALFGAGAFLAYAPATIIAKYLGGKRAETRFAATMVLLAGATIALTAVFFGYWYRLYYARWHEPAFSIGWTFQYVFTMAAAFYHFLVLGLRMYLPLGLAALLAFSLMQARQRR